MAPNHADLSELIEKLGITFNSTALLKQALIHRSYLNESRLPGFGSNERLEFLGDAILGMLISEELFRRFPDFQEGELTRLRSQIVRQETLAKAAKTLGIGSYLYLSRGERKLGDSNNSAILSGAFEALICAIYLDQGEESCRSFILTALKDKMDNLTLRSHTKDHKSTLQEMLQAAGKSLPVYRMVSTSGPEHKKRFNVDVLSEGKILGSGQGASKQEAEEEAASQALYNMK